MKAIAFLSILKAIAHFPRAISFSIKPENARLTG